MTSITWGTTHETHDFNTISHSIDENVRAGPGGVLKRKVQTKVRCLLRLMLSKIISDDAQRYRAISTTTEVANKTGPFSSLHLPVRGHGAYLSPNFHQLKPVFS